MANLFLPLAFICFSSALKEANFENSENSHVSGPGYSEFGKKLQHSQGNVGTVESVESYQNPDGPPKGLPAANSESLQKLNYQPQIGYLDSTNSVTKRDKKSVKASVNKKVKNSKDEADEYLDDGEDDEQDVNEELEKEYLKQIQRVEMEAGGEDDDGKYEETNDETEEEIENTIDEDSDNNEDNNNNIDDDEINLDNTHLSDDDSVTCGEKKNDGGSGKHRKENVNWLLLQPSNDSLTVVRHKTLVRSEGRDKNNRNKKGIRHELDEEKHKMKDMTEMNTMKKKLTEDEMYKRIMQNLDSDSDREKEIKKWEKYKNNKDSVKPRKQKKKEKYQFLNAKDLTHEIETGMINEAERFHGHNFGKAKFKAPHALDYTEINQEKENTGRIGNNGKKKHNKTLRKFKDNFEDVINKKISKSKNNVINDNKKQNSPFEEHKGDVSVASGRKRPHGPPNKLGKVKHFLENDSKSESNNLPKERNKKNNRDSSPIQIYRVDVENRKIVPVLDKALSGNKRRGVHNSDNDNSEYFSLPYNISIEFFKDPSARDMRKRSLKYINEGYSPWPDPSDVNSEKKFSRNEHPTVDTKSIDRDKIIDEVYKAIKERNPEFFHTDRMNINDFIKTGNDAINSYNIGDYLTGKGNYVSPSSENNVHPEFDNNHERLSANNIYPQIVNDEKVLSIDGQNDLQRRQYESSEKESDVKRNANSNLMNELSKLIQKKAAKINGRSTEAYSATENGVVDEKITTVSTDTTCLELFKEYKNNNNDNSDRADDKSAADSHGGVTVPTICTTNKAGKDKYRNGKPKTTRPVTKPSPHEATTASDRKTTPAIDYSKFADMLNGNLADRFLEEMSKKINRSRRISKEFGFCSDKMKVDPTRRCIENGREELLPLTTLKNVMYRIKQNKPEGSLFLCNTVPSELSSFLTFLTANTKQKAKECLMVNKKSSNFIFSSRDNDNTKTISSSLKKTNDFNLIPEKQLNLLNSKLNRKFSKSEDYETEEKDNENIDKVLTKKVLRNMNTDDKSGSNSKDVSEFIDDILKDEDTKLVTGDFDSLKPVDGQRNNDYDYNVNPYSSEAQNYGNRQLERFYYGKDSDNTNRDTKSGYNIFNADSENAVGQESDGNSTGPLKKLLFNPLFNTISNKIFNKNKPISKEQEESQFIKEKRQRLSDRAKIKMHNLLYEDGVPEDGGGRYYGEDDEDVRVKKDIEKSNTDEEEDYYDYDSYYLPFSEDNEIADDSNLENAFVVRTPVEEYNSYYG